jgi:hypothetical protein
MNAQPRKRSRASSSQSESRTDADRIDMEWSDQSASPSRIGDDGSSQSTALPDAAMETVRVVAEAVTSQARSLAGNVAEELGATAEAGVAKGADAMQGFARAIESAAAELESRSPQIASRVRGVADRVDGFSNNIRGRSIGELLTAARDLARSQPTAFIAGAVIAGFALSRFIKSSAAPQQPATPPFDEPGMGQ